MNRTTIMFHGDDGSIVNAIQFEHDTAQPVLLHSNGRPTGIGKMVLETFSFPDVSRITVRTTVVEDES